MSTSLSTLLDELGCDDGAVVTPQRMEEAEYDAETSAHCLMLRLPPDLLRATAEVLNARDLHAMGAACRQLASLTAPLVPGLRLRLYAHQQRSLQWMRRCEQRAGLEAGLPRGGILADEPGLGKTVTVLATVLKTAGLQSGAGAEEAARAVAEVSWLALDPYYQAQTVMAVLKAVRGRAMAEALSELYRPSVNTLYAACAPGARRYATLAAFEEDARRAMRAVRNGAADEGTSEALLFTTQILEEELARARRGGAPPPPCASRTTLVVVPRPLLAHWEAQLEMHVEAAALAAAGGVWVDRSSTAPLPPPQALARYALVLTTSERLSREGGRHKAASSPLRNVRWLRLVVDEGHVLGNAGLSHKVCR